MVEPIKTEIWIKVPNINREICIKIGAVHMGSLGCHSTISNVNCTWSARFESIRSTDKSDPVKSNYHYGETRLDGQEIDAVKLNVPSLATYSVRVLPEDMHRGFIQVVNQATQELYFLSDNVNKHSQIREVHYGKRFDKEGKVLVSTHEFVKWLIKNRIGHVTASPVTQNRNHRSTTNYSFVQGWIWVPPHSLPRAFAQSAVRYNDKALPDWDKWYETVGADLGGVNPGQVDKLVWEGEKFQRPVPDKKPQVDVKITAEGRTLCQAKEINKATSQVA